jgi:hypothetical protein
MPTNENVLLHTKKQSQIIRGNLKNWKVTRFGNASRGIGNTRVNIEIRSSLSRKRITVSLKYVGRSKTRLNEVFSS